MSIISDVAAIGSSIAGAKGAKKKNRTLAAQYREQQGYANKQNAVAGTIQKYLAELGLTGADTYLDPLNSSEAGIQDASYGEELARNTVDQAQRRTALQDTERLRQDASGTADATLRDFNTLRSGVGRVDPITLANTMRLNRTQAINAGYDDAANAAKTISLRTGAGAGDALTAIARNRNKDIATLIGDPDTEALTTASNLNTTANNTAASNYNLFSGKANNFYDSSFSPVTYGQVNKENAQKDQALDLQRYDTLFGGGTNQAAIYGNAGAGLRSAADTKNRGTDYNILGQLISGVGKGADALVTDIATAGKGGFNMSSLAKMFGG